MSTRHADTKQALARAVQKVPRAGTMTVQTPTQPGTWVPEPHAGSTNPSFQKNIFGEHWWQEECSRAGLHFLLASHWFKALGMKHSESLSLLLCKNYTDMTAPDGSWCYFSFCKMSPPHIKYKWLKSVVHQMRWKWGLESGALTRMKKGLFSSGVCSLRTALCCNTGLSLAPDASQHKTQHVPSVHSICLAGWKLFQRCS